jgi:hypothetical protein
MKQQESVRIAPTITVVQNKQEKDGFRILGKGVSLRKLLQFRSNKGSQANVLLPTLALSKEKKRTVSTVIYVLPSSKTERSIHHGIVQPVGLTSAKGALQWLANLLELQPKNRSCNKRKRR